MNQQQALVILNAIPGLTNRRILQLIEHYGSALHVLELDQAELEASGLLPAETITNISNFPKDNFLFDEYNLISKNDVSIVTLFDDHYPTLLKTIVDAPVVLYVRGTLTSEDQIAVALVGSRRCSMYGLLTAERFAVQLAECGLTIVSGLARGIDGAAHRGALKAGGRTLAVLGSGLNVIYPSEHKSLADQISKKGALISEFPMNTQPIQYNFPRRNRIVSGLSLGTVVIEASVKSGALITSDFALEQGREVFAVPGKVDTATAQGANTLIREGAKMAMTAEDILKELNVALRQQLKATASKQLAVKPSDNPKSKPRLSIASKGLDGVESRLYMHIGSEPVSADELAQDNKLEISQTLQTLLQLELKRCIRQLPGKRFVRIAN